MLDYERPCRAATLCRGRVDAHTSRVVAAVLQSVCGVPCRRGTAWKQPGGCCKCTAAPLSRSGFMRAEAVRCCGQGRRLQLGDAPHLEALQAVKQRAQDLGNGAVHTIVGESGMRSGWGERAQPAVCAALGRNALRAKHAPGAARPQRALAADQAVKWVPAPLSPEDATHGGGVTAGWDPQSCDTGFGTSKAWRTDWIRLKLYETVLVRVVWLSECMIPQQRQSRRNHPFPPPDASSRPASGLSVSTEVPILDARPIAG